MALYPLRQRSEAEFSGSSDVVAARLSGLLSILVPYSSSKLKELRLVSTQPAEAHLYVAQGLLCVVIASRCRKLNHEIWHRSFLARLDGSARLSTPFTPGAGIKRGAWQAGNLQGQQVVAGGDA